MHDVEQAVLAKVGSELVHGATIGPEPTKVDRGFGAMPLLDEGLRLIAIIGAIAVVVIAVSLMWGDV